ncbi:hypothetical protein OIU79_015673, partial [Salix purpurea]
MGSKSESSFRGE